MLDVREGGGLSISRAAAPDGAVGTVRWGIRNPDAACLAQWDDEGVIFNPLSWQTHLLNEAALRVLTEMQAGPRTAGELVAAVYGAGQDDEQSASRDIAVMEALLNELLHLGLVTAEPAR